MNKIAVRWPIGALLLLGSLLAAAPAVGQVSLTPDGFTNYVAGMINAGRQPASVRIVAPLTLQGHTAAGHDVQMNLDRIYGQCRADQAQCPAIVAAYAGQAASVLEQEAAAPALAALRLAVRPESYARGLPGPVPASSRSLPPGLLALVYIDAPSSMRLLNAKDLQALHLSGDQAFADALQNTAKALQPLGQVVKPLAAGQVGGFRGSAYESSRLLFPADWSGIAAQFGGHLLVAMPSAEELLYANGSVADALPRISAVAHARFAQAERPTSPSVFEWRPTGWVVTAP